MKNHFRLLFFSGIMLFLSALMPWQSLKAKTIDSLRGAWGYGTLTDSTVMVIADNVFAVARYDAPGKKFISSWGGTWEKAGDKLVRKIEWHSVDSSRVGTILNDQVTIDNHVLFIGETGIKWSRLDDGGPGSLEGAWIITGNYAGDKVSKRANAFYPRRTMKVLSGKYFHWIAYNVATKQFLNAGGGMYTTGDGKYTETIEFFTKAAESVGKKLSFDYSFDNGDWRHRGQKSTGGTLDECWSRRATLEK